MLTVPEELAEQVDDFLNDLDIEDCKDFQLGVDWRRALKKLLHGAIRVIQKAEAEVAKQMARKDLSRVTKGLLEIAAKALKRNEQIIKVLEKDVDDRSKDARTIQKRVLTSLLSMLNDVEAQASKLAQSRDFSFVEKLTFKALGKTAHGIAKAVKAVLDKLDH